MIRINIPPLSTEVRRKLVARIKDQSVRDTIAAAALYILDAFHGVLPVIILCRANSSIWADVKWCVTVNYIDRFGLVVALVVAISLVVRPPNATGSSS